jgi:HTH-type transcriptional regulator/antitoxin HigA
MSLSEHPIPPQAFPPGEFIKDELEARGLSQEDFAQIIGRPVSTVSKLINGKKEITPETARAIGAAFGTSAEVWMNLESAYRVWMSQRTSAIPEEQISRRSRLYEFAPVSEMFKRRWIRKTADLDDLEEQVRRFYGVHALAMGSRPQYRCAARKSTSYGESSAAELAWMRRAIELGSAVRAAPFSHESFVRALPSIRDHAKDVEGLRAVPTLLASWGIRLVVVQHLPGTRIDGAVIWEGGDAPLIVLSARFDRFDSIWHTLVHELTHVKHRDGTHVDTDMVSDASGSSSADAAALDPERRADSEGAALLIHAEDMEGFLRQVRGRFTERSIIEFADRQKVHPGIVVGQIQYRTGQWFTHRRYLMQGKVRSILTDAALTDGWGFTPGEGPGGGTGGGTSG